MKKKRELYVFGTRAGELQSKMGHTASECVPQRDCDPDWYRTSWPVVYELVPVTLAELRRRAKTERSRT